MRLDFNYVIVDDDYSKRRNRRRVEELEQSINKQLEQKGFQPNPQIFSSIQEFEENSNKASKGRYDLYLSDNNLGNANGPEENQHQNDGIELYLNLHQQFVCDFVLYTGSAKEEIVEKLKAELDISQNPNLFSRFTFVTRSSDANANWHKPILELIDHIISKREEMNNLRGLFAEKISKIDKHLKKILGCPESDKFYKTLQAAKKGKFASKKNVLKNLDNLRQMRNALLHQDEEFDSIKCEYKITYLLEDNNGKKTESKKEIRESETQKYRKWLKEVGDEVLSWS